jgi:hypothetical protein
MVSPSPFTVADVDRLMQVSRDMEHVVSCNAGLYCHWKSALKE